MHTPNQMVTLGGELIPLGDGQVKKSEGFGGWAEIDRPRDVSMTEWQGSKPFKLNVPIMFDGLSANVSQEDNIDRLENLGYKLPGQKEPPIINIGGVVFGKLTFWRWVIQNIDWGDSIRREDGVRLRQPGVVTLQQYVASDTIRIINAHHSKHKRSRSYTVKKGDTLQKIAAKLLKKSSRWKDIANLNNIRDPKKIKVGQRLKVPVK